MPPALFHILVRVLCRRWGPLGGRGAYRVAVSIQRTEVFFTSVQLLSRVRLFATPWTAARQASLSITNSRRLLKLMSVESVMPSNHLILCHPLLLLPSIFPTSGSFQMRCSRTPQKKFQLRMELGGRIEGILESEGWA